MFVYAIRQDDICPCNICPGDISPYQQFLTQFTPNLNSIFGGQIFLDHHFVRPELLGSKTIWTQNYLEPKILLKAYIFRPKLFWIQNVILTQFFFDPTFFGSKTFWTHNFLDTKLLCTKYSKQNNTIFLGFDSIEINLVFDIKLLLHKIWFNLILNNNFFWPELIWLYNILTKNISRSYFKGFWKFPWTRI